MSHPYYFRLLQSAGNIFALYQLLLKICSQSVFIVRPLRTAFPVNVFCTNLSAYQFHHSDKQQWGQSAPLCQANITFESPDIPGPHSTLLFVSSYVPSAMFASASGTSIHLNVPIVISLGIVAWAFSRSMNLIALSSCPSSFFSTSYLMAKLCVAGPYVTLWHIYKYPIYLEFTYFYCIKRRIIHTFIIIRHAQTHRHTCTHAHRLTITLAHLTRIYWK